MPKSGWVGSFVNPQSPHEITGDAVTRDARPRRVSPRAPLKRRLTYGGAQAQLPPEQVIGALAVLQGQSSQLLDRLERLDESPALLSGTWTIPADLSFSRNFKVQYKSVQLVNLSANVLTISAGGFQDPAEPSQVGAGILVVPKNAWACAPLIGNSLNVAGIAGSQFRLVVMSRFVPPAAGVT